jgi:hypothetical protein
MADWKIEAESVFKIVTYGLIFSLAICSFFASGLKLSAEIDVLLLFLITYTLLLIFLF